MSDQARATLEQMSIAVSTGLEKVLGKPVEIGLIGKWDDHYVLTRPVPIRASLIEMQAPLADCMVAVSAMHEQSMKAAVAAAQTAIFEWLDLPADTATPQGLLEFDDREVALEQLDALYCESTLHFSTPKGDLLLVVGHGLAQAMAARMRGETYAPPKPPKQAAPEAPTPAAAEPTFTPTPAPEPVPQPVAAPQPAPLAATAVANAAAASTGSERWEQLLSGVEVDLSAELGRTHMRLGEITSLVTDSVLTLDQHVDEPVRIYVNGTLFGVARLVVVDEEYGIEILEVFDQAVVERAVQLAA